jgi:hypothetical protein
MIKVEIPDQCFNCGGDQVLHTEVNQEGRKAHESYRASDGDKVECLECGFLSQISCDDQIAEVTWDETSPHNLKVAQEYERKLEEGERRKCQLCKAGVPTFQQDTGLAQVPWSNHIVCHGKASYSVPCSEPDREKMMTAGKRLEDLDWAQGVTGSRS